MELPGTPTRDVEERLTESHLVRNQESDPAITPHGKKLTGKTSLDGMDISENSSKNYVKGKNTLLMKVFLKSLHTIYPKHTSVPNSIFNLIISGLSLAAQLLRLKRDN
jgi:hypothetical protein